jgi:hypothetical protein
MVYSQHSKIKEAMLEIFSFIQALNIALLYLISLNNYLIIQSLLKQLISWNETSALFGNFSRVWCV